MTHEFVLLDGEEFCWRCRMTEAEIREGGNRDCRRIVCDRCGDPDACMELGYCIVTGEDL